MRILVTGSAGFIGFHLALRLLNEGHSVIGFDGMTEYYDLRLKRERHRILEAKPGFIGHVGMLEDPGALADAIGGLDIDVIVHLAAQAGVRYSLEHPETYVSSNLVGTFNLLEAARICQPKHLMLASTSSVYGGNETMPFAEMDKADLPITLYAATKKAGEAMSHSYAHLWKLPTTCFRFFTVYGPWGRPDMALFKFVEAIEKGEPIDVYGNGQMRRDFTYIDDLVGAIRSLMDTPPEVRASVGEFDSISPVAPWRTVNIGGGRPVGLLPFIDVVEACLGKKAIRNMLPMQKGDVVETFADTRLLEALTGFRPTVTVQEGVKAFVEWYRAEMPRIRGEDAEAV